ncbi:hypothetical protein HK105_205334 [Polyrhizophydium stewartii]|uniref:Uncharacterized protein n=1 Tax=Polyrhizophydium stewartii TaxID=2732419 RepID=A0ABR4N6S5_9FUNG
MPDNPASAQVNVHVRKDNGEANVRARRVGKYDRETFIDLLNVRCTSTRATLATLETKDYITYQAAKKSNSYCPGPGTYDVNYAIGRHVANDTNFALSKSDMLKQRMRNK